MPALVGHISEMIDWYLNFTNYWLVWLLSLKVGIVSQISQKRKMRLRDWKSKVTVFRIFVFQPRCENLLDVYPVGWTFIQSNASLSFFAGGSSSLCLPSSIAEKKPDAEGPELCVDGGLCQACVLDEDTLKGLVFASSWKFSWNNQGVAYVSVDFWSLPSYWLVHLLTLSFKSLNLKEVTKTYLLCSALFCLLVVALKPTQNPF